MSRVAKNPVNLPVNVEFFLSGNMVSIKGPLGLLSQKMLPSVHVDIDGQSIMVTGTEGDAQASAMSGTMRALLANMVAGVSRGFERKLHLVGVGYKAQAQGSKLNLSLGFSHPLVYEVPAGIKVETPSPTEILIKGIDRQLVGQVAAKVRAYRSPEPYKGKGVRYSDEIVILKETKKK